MLILASVEECLHTYIVDDVMLTDYAWRMIILICCYALSKVPWLEAILVQIQVEVCISLGLCKPIGTSVYYICKYVIPSGVTFYLQWEICYIIVSSICCINFPGFIDVKKEKTLIKIEVREWLASGLMYHMLRVFKITGASSSNRYKSNEDYVYVRGRGRGKYICEECGIRCKKPSMLKKHIRTHTDVRPYVCKLCNFAFKTKGKSLIFATTVLFCFCLCILSFFFFCGGWGTCFRITSSYLGFWILFSNSLSPTAKSILFVKNMTPWDLFPPFCPGSKDVCETGRLLLWLIKSYRLRARQVVSEGSGLEVPG